MKRTVFLLMLLSLCLSLSANNVTENDAVEIVVDNIKYQIENDNVILIDGSSCSGDLIIPSTIEHNSTIYTVSEIGEKAFKQNEKITSVTFPPSIEVIGEYAFLDCSNIESIDFSEGLKQIGAYAFLYCNKPYYVTLPSSLQTIKESAFGGMTNIREIYCKSITPPELIFDYNINTIVDENGYISSAYPFGSNTSIVTLYVPVGTSDDYRQAEGWQYSKEIVETDDWTVSIDKINVELSSSENIIIYSIDGIKIDKHDLSPGIYIVQKTVGSQSIIQKVLVR